MTKPLTVVACGVLVLIATAVTNVAAGPQTKCLVGKNKCVSEKAGALLKCEQKAETPGRPADPNAGGCVDRAKARFDGGSDPTKGCFERLETTTPNDCVTFDDTASVEMLVDACVAEIVEAIDPASIDQSRCGVGKKKCAAKTLKSILKCHQKAEMQPSGSRTPRTSTAVSTRRRPSSTVAATRREAASRSWRTRPGTTACRRSTTRRRWRGSSTIPAWARSSRPSRHPPRRPPPRRRCPPPGVRRPREASAGSWVWRVPTATRPVRRTDAGTTARRTAMPGSSGSDANCQAVLGALGTLEAFDGIANLNGVGCVRSSFSICPFGGCSGSRLLRDVTNPTTAGAAFPATERACACL